MQTITPTLDEILTAIKENCDLGMSCDNCLSQFDFYDRVVERLVDALEQGFEYTWDSGASKGVLIFPHLDVVLKFPFQGYYSEEEFSDAEADWLYEPETEEERERIMQWRPEKEPVPLDFVYPFECARNFFLESNSDWDYCATECALYEAAAAESLDTYFAKEELIAVVDGYPIYAQTKVKPFSTSGRTCSAEERTLTKSKCEELDVQCIDYIWVSDFFREYGEEEYVRLIAFLDKYEIGDLHSNNIGYLDGFPILLDYSDYND